MLHAQHRKFNSEFECLTVTRILAIFSLVAASVLVFAMAPGSVAANSSRRAGVDRAERSNHRIRVPSAAAAADAVQPINFPLPFAPIAVDRTADDAPRSTGATLPRA